MRISIAAFALLGLLVGCGSSDSSSQTTSQNGPAGPVSPTISSQDRQFVHDAAGAGMEEVQLGQMATQQASSDQVKQFGQMMVTDHTKANNQLQTLASQKGIAIPTDLDSSARADVDKLSKLNGADFDHNYVDMQVTAHKDAIDLFNKEINDGQDADIKAFAAQTMPTLEKHLQAAQDAQRGVPAPGGM
jgi:putative membrane protein